MVWIGLMALAAVLSGCASGPSTSTSGSTPPGKVRPLPPGADGLPDKPPADLATAPDAEPRIEPIRSGGPNKPYTVAGRSYEPQTADSPWRERGQASWYGRKFHGRRTASGEVYSMYGMTAAHRTLPIPSYARVRNVSNGREVIVRVNDRGPFHSERVLDLSYAAALKLGVLAGGVAQVEIERLTFADIRSGSWRREGVPTVVAASADAASTVVAAPPAAASSKALPSAKAAPAAESKASKPVLVQPQGSGAVAALVATTTPPRVVASTVAAALPPDLAPADDNAERGVYAAQPAARFNSPDYATSRTEPVAAQPDVVSAALPGAPAQGAAANDLPPEQRARAYTTEAKGFWVQLGAFKQREGAESFQRRVSTELDALSPLLAIFNESAIFRLQAGPYATREEARGVAHHVRDKLNLVPVIVERR